MNDHDKPNPSPSFPHLKCGNAWERQLQYGGTYNIATRELTCCACGRKIMPLDDFVGTFDRPFCR